MHNYFATVFASLTLFCLGSFGQTISPANQAKARSEQRNEYGAVVRDQAGRRTSYNRAELAGQAARWAAANPAEPKGRPETTAQSLGFRQVWTYASFGEGIGKSNITVARNGFAREIYAGASSFTFGEDDYWYALRYRVVSGTYEQVFVSQRSSVAIRRITIGNVTGSLAPEILVALADGRVQIIDQSTKMTINEIATAATDLRGLIVADVDRDGRKEIAVCSDAGLFVYSGDGALEWQLTTTGGYDLVAAQMDGDPAVEIALSSGDVVDAGSHTVQWTWPDGFGEVEAADIDSDGMAEIVASPGWYFVWSYDVDTQLPKWSIPIDLDIGAIRVADIDQDSVQELIVGEGQWGSVMAFDTVTKALEWSIHNPEHGVTDIGIGDVDRDGDVEVLWGAGATSTGPDRLYVANWKTEEIEWENVQIEGPFLGPEIGDLDGDGRAEVVYVSSSSDAGYGSGRIIVFDSQTLTFRGMSDEIALGDAWTGIHDLRLRNVDADPQLEILIATDWLYDGLIEIYDYQPDGSFLLQWTNETHLDGSPFYSVDAADVDGDGNLEIIAGGGREHTGAEGVYVYVYDYLTTAEEWHSLQMGSYWDEVSRVAVGDLDRDGTSEIAGMVGGGDVYVFDGPSGTLEAILPGSFTDLQLLPGPTISLLLLSDTAGDLSAQGYVAGSYQEIFRKNLQPEPIDAFTLTPGGALWTSTDGTLKLMGTTGPLWQTSSFGPVFGRRVRWLPGLPVMVTGGSYSANGFLPFAAGDAASQTFATR